MSQDTYNPFGNAQTTRWSSQHPTPLTQLAAQMPPVVYFLRTPGLIKVGHTTNLLNRTRQLGATMRDLLAFRAGTRDDEAAMHVKFAKHLARGDEWFYPHPDVWAEINEIRAGWGFEPVYA